MLTQQPGGPAFLALNGAYQPFHQIRSGFLTGRKGGRVSGRLRSPTRYRGLSKRKEGKGDEKRCPGQPDEQGQRRAEVPPGRATTQPPPTTRFTASPMAPEIMPSNPN